MAEQPQVLVTGGTGKTGRRIAAQLRARGLRPRIATRTPAQDDQARLDWNEPETFGPALAGVEAVYLLAPTDRFDTLDAMRPLIDRALDTGIERFVLLSASVLEAGGPMMGAVHAYLAEHASQWVVLRPSWFMQNFSENQHVVTIRDEGAVYSATGDGRVAFIDAEDIASVAVEALTRPELAGRELILTGPSAISYDEVAAVISEASGRPVMHRRLTEMALAERYQSSGLPADYARTLAAMDTAIAEGVEDRTTDDVRLVTGRSPTGFADFARRESTAWT